MHLLVVPSVVLGANFWTLISGMGLGGAVMSLFATFFILIPLSIPYEDFILKHALLGQNLDVWQQRSLVLDFRLVAMGLYLATILILGPRLFRRYEATGVRRELLGSASGGFDRFRMAFLQAGENPTLNLVRKELALHQVSFLLALGFCSLWLLLLGYLNVSALLRPASEFYWMVPSFQFDGHPIGYFLAPAAVYLVLIPVLVGASAVAEEKTLGTLVMNMTMPSLRSRQWIVKCGVALGTSFVLGVLLPLAMALLAEPLRVIILTSKAGREGVSADVFFFGMVPLIQITLTSIALWASSNSLNTLRAAGLGLGMTALVLIWSGVCVNLAEFFASTVERPSSTVFAGVSDSFKVLVAPVSSISFFMAILLAFQYLGYRRYKDLESDFWLQLKGIGGIFLFMLSALTLFGVLVTQLV